MKFDKDVKEAKYLLLATCFGLGLVSLAVGIFGLYYKGHGLLAISLISEVVVIMSTMATAYLRIREAITGGRKNDD